MAYLPKLSQLWPCGTQIAHKSNSTDATRKLSRPARRCLMEYRWNRLSSTSFGKDTSAEMTPPFAAAVASDAVAFAMERAAHCCCCCYSVVFGGLWCFCCLCTRQPANAGHPANQPTPHAEKWKTQTNKPAMANKEKCFFVWLLKNYIVVRRTQI